MALDDFKTEKQFEIGSIRSRKKVENVKLKEDEWKLLMEADPWIVSVIANRRKQTEVRAIVQLMDEMIETGKGWAGENIGEEAVEKIEDERDEIVEENLED